ncbi:DcaP family trimeric outer membrane transporter [uncultured Umboniibacter sp.]|uniref:DcaP family trimeric outer membrane transporter n=1 Tax=uncultured Umboniibacter sp. TaxID=1798917 RepID=UPI0026102744|nr:DcaP family trimeric outer membrane transporter [uncultured Umboniibacter sp.]
MANVPSTIATATLFLLASGSLAQDSEPVNNEEATQMDTSNEEDLITTSVEPESPDDDQNTSILIGEDTFKIYGHAMLDMGFQTKQNDPEWADLLRPTKLPSYDDEYSNDGHFYSGVRQSRLGFASTSPTAYGELKTVIEFDLVGVGDDAGNHALHLLKAWGEFGDFGAGQFDSVFMDASVFPNTIEYWGPNGLVFYRNVQVRWTPWRNGDSRFAVSLERPGGSGDGGEFSDFIATRGLTSDFEVPDIAAHYRLVGDWGHFQAAGILRQIKWQDNNADSTVDLSGEQTGWGINLSTNYFLGRHVIRASTVYGEGIQNYLNDASVDIGIDQGAGTDPRNLTSTAIPVLGVVAFIDLNWSEQWTSSIGYSLQDNDLPASASEAQFQTGQYALANLLWHPSSNIFMGPELQWAERENYDGYKSDDLRIQFSVKYNFSKTF